MSKPRLVENGKGIRVGNLNLTILKEIVESGNDRRVYQVRDQYGKFYAYKHGKRRSIKKEIKSLEGIKKANVPHALLIASGSEYILRQWIEGQRGDVWLKTWESFGSPPDIAAIEDLLLLLDTVARAGLYIGRLDPEDMIWEPTTERWYIVNSGSVIPSTPRAAANRYFWKMLKRWGWNFDRYSKSIRNLFAALAPLGKDYPPEVPPPLPVPLQVPPLAGQAFPPLAGQAFPAVPAPLARFAEPHTSMGREGQALPVAGSVLPAVEQDYSPFSPAAGQAPFVEGQVLTLPVTEGEIAQPVIFTPVDKDDDYDDDDDDDDDDDLPARPAEPHTLAGREEGGNDDDESGGVEVGQVSIDSLPSDTDLSRKELDEEASPDSEKAYEESFKNPPDPEDLDMLGKIPTSISVGTNPNKSGGLG